MRACNFTEDNPGDGGLFGSSCSSFRLRGGGDVLDQVLSERDLRHAGTSFYKMLLDSTSKNNCCVTKKDPSADLFDDTLWSRKFGRH